MLEFPTLPASPSASSTAFLRAPRALAQAAPAANTSLQGVSRPFQGGTGAFPRCSGARGSHAGLACTSLALATHACLRSRRLGAGVTARQVPPRSVRCHAAQQPERVPVQAEPAIQPGFLEFPDDNFFFGAATAAYQIEGAATEDGRKPSIWDDFSHTEGWTEGKATGDVACDHYHLFREDVELMVGLGLQAYRFSISWSRLIPDGDGEVNPAAVEYYSNLIDALLAKGITPWITLYHWDMPSALEQKFGGWLGPKEKIVSAFGNYARTCFSLFGARVKHWITLNEPWCSAVLGYLSGEHAPGRDKAPETEPYIAAHHMLVSHAEAVAIYRKEFAAAQRGTVGVTLNADWRQPWNAASDGDREAARQAMDFSLGWFAHPIWFGCYPQCMVDACGDRLPKFTPEEQELLRGSSDFFGLNSYSSNFSRKLCKPLDGKGYWWDIGVEWWHKDPRWEKTDMGWPVVPWGFRELILYIHRTYSPSGGIVITENGCAFESAASVKFDDRPGALQPQPRSAAKHLDAKAAAEVERSMKDIAEDVNRRRFLKAHLSAVHAARVQGADVRGYFAWSLLDNFEWGHGYTKRFGIVHVDYATQRRTVKASGKWFARVIEDRGFEAPLKDEQFAGGIF
mmetsp:Transcript_7262/g.18343  ORF Transcript_7262/g.18343 Transcript_7262/m.18343 type:complete len:626 (-) Transcript_7262:106-1983(-)